MKAIATAVALISLATVGWVLYASRETRVARFEQITAAAEKGDFGTVDKLLETLPNIDLKDNAGCTLLWYATLNKDVRLARILLDRKADPNVEANGATLLGLAANGRKNGELVDLLLSHGADPNRTGPELHWTPLHYAANRGNAEATRLLLAHGAKVDALTPDGDTPLHMAALKATIEPGGLDVVRILIAAGANVRLKSKGLTVYQLATKYAPPRESTKQKLATLRELLK